MIELAYSPCPNDTFCFDAWVKKKIASKLHPQPVLADIQQLNQWAFENRYPITKLSTYCLGNVCKDYLMLPVGAAISHTGPKLVAKNHFELSSLKDKCIAIPGLDTTAYLLFRILFETVGKVIPCRYEEVPALVLKGEADVGLIIHETRFVFQEMGLIELADLGKLLDERYHIPIPLGVIAARKDLPNAVIDEVISSIEQSVRFALSNPASSRAYVLAHSQEKDARVIDQHIATYVNQETVHMSKQGLDAVKTFFALAVERGLLPKEALL